MDIPSVRTIFAEEVGSLLDSFIGNDRLAAVLAVEYRDRHAPCSLTGNTPVTSVVYHSLDTLFAPFRYPLNLADVFDSIILKALYGAEPLFSCSEKDRILTSPAVRILVDDLFECEKCAALFKILSNDLVGICCRKTCIFACLSSLDTLCVNRNDNADLGIFLAYFKVINTEARSCMNTACTAFKRNVIANDNERISSHKRVSSFHIFKLFTCE